MRKSFPRFSESVQNGYPLQWSPSITRGSFKGLLRNLIASPWWRRTRFAINSFGKCCESLHRRGSTRVPLKNTREPFQGQLGSLLRGAGGASEAREGGAAAKQKWNFLEICINRIFLIVPKCFSPTWQYENPKYQGWRRSGARVMKNSCPKFAKSVQNGYPLQWSPGITRGSFRITRRSYCLRPVEAN